MKCKICGYRATDISHMAAHYRKKHPVKMKKSKKADRTPITRKGSYCPTCGKKI